jgi:dihydrodipicolinate synthase/N-acetylneuraminate lyase
MPLALYEDGSFDEASQRRLIRYYMAAEADGLAVAVHTTQFEIRRPEHNLLERVLAVAADELTRFEEKTGQTAVKIAGACGPAEQAVSEAKLAKSLGYDAVLLSPGGLSHKIGGIFACPHKRGGKCFARGGILLANGRRRAAVFL